MTLTEIIGVLAILSLLAAMVLPSVIRRMDQSASIREKTELGTFTNALQQSILRSVPKTIPAGSGIPTAIASYASLPPALITNTPRGIQRAFLVNPGMAGLTLPFTQDNFGTSPRPTNAQVLMIASLSRTQPLTSAVTNNTSANFSNIWNAPENTVPAGWSTNWTGSGYDQRIQRIDVSALFHRLMLINHDAGAQPSPWFSIDSSVASTRLDSTVWDNYYLDGSMVGLRDSNQVVQVTYLLQRDISFIFEAGSWHGSIEGEDNEIDPAASIFLTHALAFFNAPISSGGMQGTSQFSVLVAVYAFMFDYTLWANECPHFNYHGASLTSVPEYILINDMGQNSGRIDAFSGKNGLFK